MPLLCKVKSGKGLFCTTDPRTSSFFIDPLYKESRDVEEFGAYGEDDADADIFFSELHNDAYLFSKRFLLCLRKVLKTPSPKRVIQDEVYLAIGT